MSDRVLFGELRSVLERPANSETWRALTALVDAFSERALVEQVIPHAQGAMRRWPDSVRVAPRRWIELLRAGERAPQLALARELVWSGITRALVEEEDFAALIDLPGSPSRAASDIMVTVDPLGFDGVVALEESGCLKYMTRISLPRNKFERGAIRAMARALASAPNLRALDLAACNLNEEDMRALASPLGFDRLEVLELADNDIKSAGLNHLLSRRWPALQRLTLSNNRISAGGLVPFEDDLFDALSHLDLMGNPIADDGVRWLAESRTLRHLEHLDLSDCNLHDGAARALATSPYLRHVSTLKLGLNVISMDALALVDRRFS